MLELPTTLEMSAQPKPEDIVPDRPPEATLDAQPDDYEQKEVQDRIAAAVIAAEFVFDEDERRDGEEPEVVKLVHIPTSPSELEEQALPADDGGEKPPAQPPRGGGNPPDNSSPEFPEEENDDSEANKKTDGNLPQNSQPDNQEKRKNIPNEPLVTARPASVSPEAEPAQKQADLTSEQLDNTTLGKPGNDTPDNTHLTPSKEIEESEPAKTQEDIEVPLEGEPTMDTAADDRKEDKVMDDDKPGGAEHERPATENDNKPDVDYTHRLPIPEASKSWDTELPDYDPPRFTTEWVQTTGVELGVSDPDSPTDVDFAERPSFVPCGYAIDEQGRPLNPMGRQGLGDRGDLAKWGPNQAADPVVIAVDPQTSDRKILLVRRKDTSQWALPGGMVDPGEHVSETARRELLEEAGVDLGEMEGEVIYEGYVVDPRNTDNAWMETTARRFLIRHTPEATSGDDAVDARWFSANSMEELVAATQAVDQELGRTPQPLYASHDQIIEAALV